MEILVPNLRLMNQKYPKCLKVDQVEIKNQSIMKSCVESSNKCETNDLTHIDLSSLSCENTTPKISNIKNSLHKDLNIKLNQDITVR